MTVEKSVDIVFDEANLELQDISKNNADDEENCKLL